MGESLSPDARARYRALKAEQDALYEEEKRLTAHLKPAFDRIMAEIDEITDGNDCVFTCEACGEPIFEGDYYGGGGDSDIYTCEECSPKYSDMVDFPEYFETWEGEPMTREIAQKLVDQHVAAGGSPDDKMVTRA